MIIFDLDGVLADCEHRRHFVQPNKCRGFTDLYEYELATDRWFDKYDGQVWKRDWNAFYDSCDQDKPICSVINIYNTLRYANSIGVVKIWSGRTESVRKKTEEWLENYEIYFDELKMRPINDSTPCEKLKEKWLDEYISSMWPKLPIPSKETEGKVLYRKNYIDLVFDSDSASVKMWQRRGIFVFNCMQQDWLL